MAAANWDFLEGILGEILLKLSQAVDLLINQSTSHQKKSVRKPNHWLIFIAVHKDIIMNISQSFDFVTDLLNLSLQEGLISYLFYTCIPLISLYGMAFSQMLSNHDLTNSNNFR